MILNAKVFRNQVLLTTGQEVSYNKERAQKVPRLGWVAQLVEQRPEKPCVRGSIPFPATKNKARSTYASGFFVRQYE